jgi:protein-tyrosine phosphatase
LIPQFPTATKLFNNALASGGKVLACCMGGMSRSPTFVIAYIMETFRVDFIRAYHFVQGKRLCINPNEGFKSQLKVSESQTCHGQYNGLRKLMVLTGVRTNIFSLELQG